MLVPMSGAKTHVVFYFPWKELSGGPVYLSSLAKQLGKGASHKVSYVDYEIGQAAKLLRSTPEVELIYVKDDDYRVHFDSPVVLITPIYWAHWIPKLPPQSRVLFVNWHKMSIPVLQNSSGIRSRPLRRFLKLVADNNGVFFCDKSHVLGQDAKDARLLEAIVPISIEQKKTLAPRGILSDGEANIGVLGRLSPDKISSVLNLLENFEAVQTGLRKKLHIIGDGPGKEAIDPKDYPSLEVIFVGELPYKNLHKYLRQNLDIVFGMGTSVLEAAALRIPSVIIPHSMDSIRGDNYVFIQDTAGACLGWHPNEYGALGVQPTTLQSIFDQTFKSENKSILADAAHTYFLENHILPLNEKKLADQIEKTSLHADSLEVFFPKESASNANGNMRKITKFPGLYYRFDRESKARLYLLGAEKLPLPISVLGVQGALEKTISVLGIPLVRARLTDRKLKLRLYFPDFRTAWNNSIQRFAREVALKLEVPRAELVFDVNRSIAQLQNRIEISIDASTQRSLSVSGANTAELESIKSSLAEIEQESTRMIHLIRQVGVDVNSSRESNPFDGVPFADSYLEMTIPTDILDERSLEAFRGDIREQYVNLIRGLPSESISEVVRILDRLRKPELVGSRYWFTRVEQEELRSIFDLHASRILQLSEDTWAYGKYLIPSNVISTTTFYSRYFVDDLTHLDNIRDLEIIDAGGFFGDSLLIFSEITNKSVHVFEPNPELFQLCQRTVELNQIKDVQLNQLALGAEVEKLHFFNDGDSSKLVSSNEISSYPAERLALIEVTTIDAYVRARGLRVGLIKADIEGFELQMLQGAMETIKTQRPTLLLSMYHNAEQFFGLKTFIESLELGYEFRIRKPHDTSVIIDTILIAEVRKVGHE